MLHIELITPERTLLELEADVVTLPTPQGEIAVLPNHMPLVTTLVPGAAEVLYKTAGTVKSTLLAITGGYAEVQAGSRVLILADAAERMEDIDQARVEEARERASKLLTEEGFKDDVKFADATAALERSLARLRVVRRHRSRRGSGTPETDS